MMQAVLAAIDPPEKTTFSMYFVAGFNSKVIGLVGRDRAVRAVVEV
jgi:hypothetical protein